MNHFQFSGIYEHALACTASNGNEMKKTNSSHILIIFYISFLSMCFMFTSFSLAQQHKDKVLEVGEARLEQTSARDLLDLALHQSSSIAYVLNKAELMSRVAEVHAMTGDKARALDTLRKAVLSSEDYEKNKGKLGTGNYVDFLIKSGVRLSEKGDPDAGRSVLKKAFLFANKVDSVYSKIDLSIECAESQVAVGDRASAVGTLEAASTWAKTLSEDTGFSSQYERIIVARVSVYGIDRAIQDLSRMKNPRPSPEVLGKVVKTLKGWEWNVGQPIVERLIEIAQGLEDEGDKADALLEIAFALVDRGDIKGAIEIGSVLTHRARAVETTAPAASLNYDVTRAEILAVIALAQAKVGNMAEALKNSRNAFELADAHKDNIKELRWSWFLGMVVQARAKSGDLAGAQKLVATLKVHHRTEPLLGVAEAQAAAGEREGALMTLRDAVRSVSVPRNVRDDDQHKLLITIARLQSRLGDVAGASLTAEAVGKAHCPRHTESDVLAESAEVQADLGNHERGLNMLRGIDVSNDRYQLAEKIARVRVLLGDVAGAVEWASELDTPELRAAAFLGAAEGTLVRKPQR